MFEHERTKPYINYQVCLIPVLSWLELQRYIHLKLFINHLLIGVMLLYGIGYNSDSILNLSIYPFKNKKEEDSCIPYRQMKLKYRSVVVAQNKHDFGQLSSIEQPLHRRILGVYVSIYLSIYQDTGIFQLMKLFLSLVELYGKYIVVYSDRWMDGSTWYVQTCATLGLEDRLHSFNV